MSDSHPEFGFKFNIGDDVIFSVAARTAARFNAARPDSSKKTTFYDTQASPHPFAVVGRILEECYGGVQRHYYLRASNVEDRVGPVAVVNIKSATVDGLFRASEIELEAIAVAYVASNG